MRAKSLENSFRCGNLIFIPCASNETMDYPLATQKPVQSDNGGRVLDLGFPAANPKVQERYHVVDGCVHYFINNLVTKFSTEW